MMNRSALARYPVYWSLAAPLVLVMLSGCESTGQTHSSQQKRVQSSQAVTSAQPVISAQPSSRPTGQDSIPIMEEKMQVGKREVQEGTTRIQKRTVEKPVEQDVKLRDETVQVERRAVDRPVKNPDKAFQDQTIEMTETKEVPMVSKQTRQTGEIALRKDATERTETIRDTVRSTDVDVVKSGEEQARGTDWSAYESDFRKNFQTTYGNSGLSYQQVKPAYRQGYEMGSGENAGSDWSAAEPQARGQWEQSHQEPWDQYRDAVRYGWERARRSKG